MASRRCAPFALVDAFAPSVHAGNPAAVVQLASFTELSDHSMQAIATEVNVPATAFIAPAPDSDDGATYDIRWYSVKQELPLCGHATFGSAKALLASGEQPAGSSMLFRSHMGAGNLTVTSSPDHDALELSLESLPPAPAGDSVSAAALAAALGVDAGRMTYVGRNQYDIIIELDSPDLIEVSNPRLPPSSSPNPHTPHLILAQALDPDQALLEAIPCRGFLVTAAGSCDRSPTADFISRFFGPSMGIPEDPATGSAQCALAPYWAGRLGKREAAGFRHRRGADTWSSRCRWMWVQRQSECC
jgi:predicted PhzF superfamily epimerase YddE/YHI9